MSGPPSYRWYRIVGLALKPLMRFWFRIHVEGQQHIPPSGPAILAANHCSNVDPVLLACAIRRPVSFMAKIELFIGPLGWILRLIGQFPVRRGSVDREALRQSSVVVAAGGLLGLFPEGGRGDGGFSTIHSGLAYLMLRQPCPVVPVAILGTERVGRRLGWLPLASPVRIVVGRPIEGLELSAGRAARRSATEILGHKLREFRAGVEAGAKQAAARSGRH
ncbi:MAG TPA: lysophospholipid acyltransferase family protein [Actinomycetes bacterium]|jgi:1-acyl-sn-glycerol-3-phosphate acyltransferase|nr:lysophospholipid acyltransferase family protein [Actinomycetes bacterium]